MAKAGKKSKKEYNKIYFAYTKVCKVHDKLIKEQNGTATSKDVKPNS